MGDKSLLKVVDNYLAWELAKHHIRSFIDNKSPPLDKLDDIAQKTKDLVKESNFSLEKKLEFVENISTSNIAHLFKNCSWTMRDYPVRKLGTVLPVAGDLPPDIITESLPVVLKYIDKQRKEKNKENSVVYISNLMKIPGILAKFPVIVIEPGRLQRSEKKMEVYHGSGNWEVTQTKGYIEDGVHRAIALILLKGQEEIRCYLGRHPSLL